MNKKYNRQIEKLIFVIYFFLLHGLQQGSDILWEAKNQRFVILWNDFMTSKIIGEFNHLLFIDIIIQILGIGKCEWTEQRRLYHSDEIYLKSEIQITEPTEGSKIVSIFMDN